MKLQKKLTGVLAAVMMVSSVTVPVLAAEDSVFDDQETFPGMIATETKRSGEEAAPKKVTDHTLKVGFCPSAVDVYYNRIWYGIQDTLEEVPADRVINAVPFYTRLWKTTGGAVTSEAIGMDQAQQVISEKNVETYWDKNTSQNYGTYEEDNSTYQIWLEDAQSIAAKVKLASKYKLAGVAAWKLGFENSGIWQVITDNLQ